MSKLFEELAEEYAKEVAEEYAKEYVKEYAKEYAKEATKKAAIKMLKDGKLTLEDIANYSNLSLKVVKELQAGLTTAS